MPIKKNIKILASFALMVIAACTGALGIASSFVWLAGETQLIVPVTSLIIASISALLFLEALDRY